MLSGGLFIQYFLRDGIRDTTAYHGLDGDTVEQIKRSLAADWFRFMQMRRPSEAETENEFIYPALRHLGWSFLVQPAVDRRRMEEERYGRFQTRALVLHMMAALEAGNPDAQING